MEGKLSPQHPDPFHACDKELHSPIAYNTYALTVGKRGAQP